MTEYGIGMCWTGCFWRWWKVEVSGGGSQSIIFSAKLKNIAANNEASMETKIVQQTYLSIIPVSLPALYNK